MRCFTITMTGSFAGEDAEFGIATAIDPYLHVWDGKVCASLSGTETLGFVVPVIGYESLPAISRLNSRLCLLSEAAIGKNKFGATMLRPCQASGQKEPDSVLVLLNVRMPSFRVRDISVEISLQTENVCSASDYCHIGLECSGYLATVPIGTKFFVSIRYRPDRGEAAGGYGQEEEEPLREFRGVVVVKSQDHILAGADDLTFYVDDGEQIDWKE